MTRLHLHGGRTDAAPGLASSRAADAEGERHRDAGSWRGVFAASSRRPLPASLITVLGTGAALLAGVLALSGASDEKPAPPQNDQPLDFFHRIHAGERQISCFYCHRTAETADFAGMPSTQLCMSCHRVVIPESPEIWKLRSYWELGHAIPWKRVYQLPDHVFFSHKAHTAGGKIGCYVCHGHVEKTDKVGKAVPLTMGWCLDCHRKQNASTECVACHR